MGSRVPHSIINVLRQKLQGLSRSQIAIEYKENDPEFDKTRELAVILK
jgi:hypothetical protein